MLDIKKACEILRNWKSTREEKRKAESFLLETGLFTWDDVMEIEANWTRRI